MVTGRNVLTFRRRRRGFVSESLAPLLSIDVTVISLGGISRCGGGIPRGARMLELTGLTWLTSVGGESAGRLAVSVVSAAVCAD